MIDKAAARQARWPYSTLALFWMIAAGTAMAQTPLPHPEPALPPPVPTDPLVVEPQPTFPRSRELEQIDRWGLWFRTSASLGSTHTDGNDGRLALGLQLAAGYMFGPRIGVGLEGGTYAHSGGESRRTLRTLSALALWYPFNRFPAFAHAGIGGILLHREMQVPDEPSRVTRFRAPAVELGFGAERSIGGGFSTTVNGQWVVPLSGDWEATNAQPPLRRPKLMSVMLGVRYH